VTTIVSIEFDASGFSIKDLHTHCVLFRYNSVGDLYTVPPVTSTVTPYASLATSINLWHLCLGHPGPAAINTLRNNSSISCKKGIPSVTLAN
jgi:hypothetical protein